MRTGPSCFSCVYFYITHESAHPYGCRTMGFKSAQLPPIAVHTSSGLA
ncbi:MAG: uracil-DNA glycosylase, partial [Deltaproteobacteria bacterium]